MRKKNRDLVAIILVLIFCALSLSACGKQEKPADPTPTPSAEPKQNSFVVKDMPDGIEIDDSTRYIESVDLYDEDSVGSEYWKVRVCSEEEQAKGNVFETDYFFFGEPQNHLGFYKLTIKENVTLPKNLYLGWLAIVGGYDVIIRGYTGYYVPDGTFENRQEIETVSLPERYPYAASKRMFANCLSLKTVYIRGWENWWKQYTIKEKKVEWDTQIASEMFLNCISLEKVVLSSVAAQNLGGTVLRERCFMNCISLKGLYPDGKEEFYRRKGWENLDCPTLYCADALTNCIKFAPVAEWQTLTPVDADQEKNLLRYDELYRELDEKYGGGK